MGYFFSDFSFSSFFCEIIFSFLCQYGGWRHKQKLLKQPKTGATMYSNFNIRNTRTCSMLLESIYLGAGKVAGILWV